MARVIVTGSSGQVASALGIRSNRASGIELTFLARPQFDLKAPEAIADEIIRLSPDAIVSAAAYTSVDTAEDEPELAMKINGTAPGVLAGAAADIGIPIVHLSTDYVFAGASSRPYVESDPAEPGTEYGRAKLRGEQELARRNPKHFILRTSCVYSPFGGNFVKTMLALAGKQSSISVVCDQVINPTSAFDIADAIIDVVQSLDRQGPDAVPYGLFHAAGSEEASWCDFANEIMRLSSTVGGPSAVIEPVATSAYPRRASRPANSRLNCAKFAEHFGYVLPGYSKALPGVVEALLTKT